jgi:hypothetical protein
MDCFTIIAALIPFASSVSDDAPAQVDFESHGVGSIAYCIIA